MVLRRRRPFLQVGCRLWSVVVLGLTVGNVLLGLKLLQVWDCDVSGTARGAPPRPKSTPLQVLARPQPEPALARWDTQRLFRLMDHVWVGPSFLRLSRTFTVCLATQSSLEKLSSIVQVARNWAGPISAALYAAGDDEYRLLGGYVQYLWRCHPEVKEKVTFHLAFPWDKLPNDPNISPTPVNGGCGKPESVLAELLKGRSLETLRWRLRNPYPQNHLRNLARKNCHTQQVFLTDVDIIPSMGLAEGLEEFYRTGKACKAMCAYVIPTYELDERAPFPNNKSHLIRLTSQGLARPFHQKVFIYNQYATNFSRWERDVQYDSVHVSHPVTNFEFLYEPFYVASDLVPVHDQRFLGYGFTRNTQVYEMFVAGYQFYVLSPVFTVHWGLQNRKGRPSWRERQNSNNRKNLDQFKREVFARYHKDPLNMILQKPKKSSRTKAHIVFFYNHISDVFKALEEVNKNPSGQIHGWRSSYECFTSPLLEDNLQIDLLMLDSPDFPLRESSDTKGNPIVRENYIRLEMANKEELYTYAQPFRIFVGTWNVNGLAPTIGLSDWLAVDPDPPDIIAVGFQELDLSKEAFLFNDSPREAEWRAAVEKGLHPGAQYQRVTLVRLVGMMLIVYVQADLVPFVKNVAFDTVGTGIMGKLGNKGAVSIRLDVHNTTVCFVNSHLAAHVEEFERRNQDYRDIVSRTSFTRFQPPKDIKDHDQVYWLGDLNYRITELDARMVKDLLDVEDYSGVLQHDQLMIQRCKEGRVFEGYTEGPITFRPTYKYDVGTDNWDSSEKNRAPAWCDRIMWKGNNIKQICYRSHPIMRISDHKPVSALFISQFRVVDQVKFRKVYEEVMKKLDKMENEGLPQVMVDKTEISFDTVKFLEPQSRELIIANTGHKLVDYEFIKKLGDDSYCKEWLKIDRCAGLIRPGEKVDVKLEVFVDKRSAFKLNSGEYKLYDILVLHLHGGKDIFITVTGTYERSCFGYSLEMLLNITVPIKELPVGKLMELEKKRNGDVNQDSFVSGYTVPKEVWFLVDHLYRHGLKVPHLFEQPGLRSETLDIRDWLDFGSQDPMPGSVHSVAEALLLLLEATAEPIFPYSIQEDCIIACSNYVQCKQIVQQLSDTSRNVFVYLCIFLQELLSQSSENLLDTKTIASLFGGVFLRDPPKPKWQSRARINQQSQDRKKAHFVYHFLVNDTSDLLSLSS